MMLTEIPEEESQILLDKRNKNKLANQPSLDKRKQNANDLEQPDQTISSIKQEKSKT